MDAILHGAMNWLQPLADIGLGEFVFFKLVNDYFSNEIQEFGMELMSRAMRWVSTIALTVTTLWVLILGYRIATGQSRESAMATMIKAGKVAIIISLASAVGVNGAMLHQTMTQNLDKEIHGLFTGDKDSTASDAIDENLAYTQVALTALDAVRVDATDPEAIEKKGRAVLMAGFGTASPPMAAGAMLLLFKFTMAFLIGIGPIFILALIFDQTKDLFKKWLFYVIGTLFSMAMLSVVTAMVLKFTAKVAAAYWAARLITLGNAEGLSSQALQQGGIGLIMTGLIISVPTLAAAIWQGNMSSFMHFSAFGGGAASSPGPQGQPAGSYVPQRIAPSEDRPDANIQRTAGTASRTIAGADSSETVAKGSRGLAGQNSRDQA
ncbi:type IV secretion system protein [Xanthomonas campestris pv. campestris]|uniref:type IV secretion system protein n=1 Tax=Xanthomonas campestris TaxID=339 RepID=UPI001F384F01|nr:type IV secretion system protein [Xanthomonas campestris]MCF8838041.1 type IV secretion system protein [Xanthomonas campestris pv. campestris]MDO0882843.1 type IV secretion system protein [Xanthomonas campestris pv. campestris]MEA0635283.1 type IV secretion system protein [Xanthomonas campestris pv. campestris]MEA0651676.1 type IV secretion system protein [Xanthomonas campestris pv. campestris]MEA0655762.1 type IV secretion system protein [Xanthomonas campestris pv. campestris]